MKKHSSSHSSRSRRSSRTVSSRRRSSKATLRPLHRRIILHPITVFFWLCVGVMLGGICFYSFADSFTIHAKVAAPLPTLPATISSPSDQVHVSNPAVAVTGSCPGNSYVKLYHNATLSGVVTCGTADTTYQVPVQLTVGSNSLQAHVYNITDDEGPQAAAVTVWYDPPPVAAPTVQPATPTTQPADQPVLQTEDYHYWIYDQDQPVVWHLTMSHGTPPYVLGIEWGDGTTDTITRTDLSPFDITHTYHPTADGNTNYAVKIQVIDAVGAKSDLQLTAIVRTPTGAGSTATNSSPTKPSLAASSSAQPGTNWSSVAKHFIWIALPSYGVVSLMGASFWLGEQQQVFSLLHHATKFKLPRHFRFRH